MKKTSMYHRSDVFDTVHWSTQEAMACTYIAMHPVTEARRSMQDSVGATWATLRDDLWEELR